MTLLADIEQCDWSADSHSLFHKLATFEPSEEGALIVISAAAALLARDALGSGRLFDLIDEFGEVAETFERGFTSQRPVLRIVGGRDA